MSSYAGQLLVATPQLVDPNFRRTVVLMLDHDDEGALGVVLNRPTETTVTEVLPRWADAVAPPAWLYQGGPVGLEQAIGVAQACGDAPADGFQPLGADYGLVDLDHVDPDGLADRLSAVRVFAGYSGWSPDQLEAEIEEGSWYVVPALPIDLLDPVPDRLWAAVLRRQPLPLAYVASYPDDPTLN